MRIGAGLSTVVYGWAAIALGTASTVTILGATLRGLSPPHRQVGAVR